MTSDSARALRSLEQAIEEAAMVTAPPGGRLALIGAVIEALATTSLEMRLAYWGYPHPGTVGDNRLVVVVGDREYVVAGVRFEGSRIVVDTELLEADPR